MTQKDPRDDSKGPRDDSRGPGDNSKGPEINSLQTVIRFTLLDFSHKSN